LADFFQSGIYNCLKRFCSFSATVSTLWTVMRESSSCQAQCAIFDVASILLATFCSKRFRGTHFSHFSIQAKPYTHLA
jgi:hypothetical protein